MNPSFDHWTVIFLVIGLQGLLLAVGLFSKKTKQSKLLAFMMAAFSVIMIYYVIYWTKYFSVLPRAIAVTQGLTYTLGPLFLYWIKKQRIAPIHWAPFLIYTVYFFLLPYLVEGVRPIVIQAQVICQIIHLLAYAVVGIFELRHSSKRMQAIGLSYLGYVLTFLGYFVLVWTRVLTLEYDYMVSFASSFFIYFIGYSAFIDRSILHYKQPRYDKSGLTTSSARAIHQELIQTMERDRPYLESDLKLSDVSNALSHSPNHISQVVNELEGCNFSEFVNRFRVDESKRLLQQGNDLTLIQIAYQSGFNNKVTFNNTFKKFTGLLPSEFRDAVLSQDPQLQ